MECQPRTWRSSLHNYTEFVRILLRGYEIRRPLTYGYSPIDVVVRTAQIHVHRPGQRDNKSISWSRINASAFPRIGTSNRNLATEEDVVPTTT